MGALRIDRITGSPGAMLWSDGRVLLGRCYRAQGPTARLVGLLATDDLASDEGLWLPGCRSIHTWGMRIEIGCIVLDRGGVVVALRDPVRPWRCLRACTGRGGSVLECAPGVSAAVRIGDQLIWRSEIPA